MNTRNTLRKIFAAHGFHEWHFSYLDDCRTFARFRSASVVELSCRTLLHTLGIRYPENCLLGIYVKSTLSEPVRCVLHLVLREMRGVRDSTGGRKTPPIPRESWEQIPIPYKLGYGWSSNQGTNSEGAVYLETYYSYNACQRVR